MAWDITLIRVHMKCVSDRPCKAGVSGQRGDIPVSRHLALWDLTDYLIDCLIKSTWHDQITATNSTSQRAPFGSALTSTHDLAGFSVKYLA